MPAAAVQWAELAAPQRGCIGQHLQGKSKKVAPPPYDFRRYFRSGLVFLHKILYNYWQFISTYVYQFSCIYLEI